MAYAKWSLQKPGSRISSPIYKKTQRKPGHWGATPSLQHQKWDNMWNGEMWCTLATENGRNNMWGVEEVHPQSQTLRIYLDFYYLYNLYNRYYISENNWNKDLYLCRNHCKVSWIIYIKPWTISTPNPWISGHQGPSIRWLVAVIKCEGSEVFFSTWRCFWVTAYTERGNQNGGFIGKNKTFYSFKISAGRFVPSWDSHVKSFLLDQHAAHIAMKPCPKKQLSGDQGARNVICCNVGVQVVDYTTQLHWDHKDPGT